MRRLTGSITVFLSLVFLLVFALFGTLLETARYTVCKNHAARTLRTGAEGLLSEYNRPLYEHYGLFFIEKAGAWKIIFGILAAALILLQAWIPYHYQHIDDDDARYVSEEVSAVVHDTLLVDDPITDEYMYWDVGEVRKDVTSPWTMYVAMCCKITGIAPAVFSHTFFPFFMIIICYVLYGMIGNVLFRGDAEKTALFLIVLSVFHIWNFTSTHTLSAMFLLRIWQGKAIVAGFILPLLMYLFYQIFMSEKQSMKWAAPLYALSFAAALLSGMGIIMAPVMMGLYGLLDGIYHRNLKRMLCIWIAALPCAVYMIYYTAGI